MSLEYAESRIKEALKLSKGNRLKAQQQLIAWTYEDAKLLHALTKPHLSGIIAYQIERVASGRAEASKVGKPPADPKKAASGMKATKDKPENFGLEILKAVAGNPAIFGLEGIGAPQRRSTASKRHVDAIKEIAAKSKHTKKP